MKPSNAVTVVLLAGGRATRLPGKLAMEIDGELLLVRVYRRLTSGGRPCVVSVREPLPDELAQRIPAPAVTDSYPDAGPLGGLASAATRVQTPLLFAAAGDLPYVDGALIDALVLRFRDEVERSTRKPEVVLPRHADGKVEPLAALYDTAALRRGAARTLASGRKKVTDALEGLRVIFYDIPPSEERKFVNINAPADVASIKSI